MKITVTFDDLNEFQTYIGSQPLNRPVQTPQEAPKADGSKKAQETNLCEEDPAPGTPLTEDFRVEVRKTLAQLNKKVGKNIASKLIKGFGVDKLTEVALSDLPTLMDRAKEALNAK